MVSIHPPINVNLELEVYLNGRGKKRLRFKPEQEFKDTLGVERHVTDLSRYGKTAFLNLTS